MAHHVHEVDGGDALRCRLLSVGADAADVEGPPERHHSDAGDLGPGDALRSGLLRHHLTEAILPIHREDGPARILHRSLGLGIQ